MAKTHKPPFLWTVMVYLAGDNNLTEESVFALTEMKKVDTDDRIAVIAQLGSQGGKHPVTPLRHQTGRTGRPRRRQIATRRRHYCGQCDSDRGTKGQVSPSSQHSCSARKSRRRGNRHWRSCDPL